MILSASMNSGLKRMLLISVEALVIFFYSVFIGCFSVALLLTAFMQLDYAILFFVFVPFFALGTGLPGLIFFGIPIAILADQLGVRKRLAWISSGICASVPAYILLHYTLSESNALFFLVALLIGAITGSKLHHRLYIRNANN